jgi:hypothetical protein
MQRVLVEGSCSGYLPVLSGVPQGSILGPLLFLLYINDIFDYVNANTSFLYLYADDAKLGQRIHNLSDCNILQDNLSKLCEWSNNWKMNFNAKKCCYMSFCGTRHELITHNYSIGNASLSRVDNFCDLGLTVTSTMSWDLHIEKSISKANKRLGLLKRTLGYTVDESVKLLCYKSLVRPLVEYGTMLWSGTSKRNITKIESLQRRASIYIVNNSNILYKERLLACDLLPLTVRREFLDIVYMYNLINGLIDTDLLNVFSFNTRIGRNRDNLTLLPNRVKSELYRHWFVNRIVYKWNNLPYIIRNCDLNDNGSNQTFKKNLKEWLFDHFRDNFEIYNNCSWFTCCICSRCVQT